MENDLTAKADKVFGALSKALAFPEKLPPNTRAVLGDAFDIVQAFRRDHRSDDGDAVTEEWLRSVGFYEDGSHLALSGWGPNRNGRIQVYWPGTDQASWFVNGTAMDAPTTRGHARRLCRALGIPLKETP